MDALFDLLNSRSPFAKGNKEPITRSNWTAKKSFLEETKLYLMSLTDVEGKPLYKTSRQVI